MAVLVCMRLASQWWSHSFIYTLFIVDKTNKNRDAQQNFAKINGNLFTILWITIDTHIRWWFIYLLTRTHTKICAIKSIFPHSQKKKYEKITKMISFIKVGLVSYSQKLARAHTHTPKNKSVITLSFQYQKKKNGKWWHQQQQ